MSQFQEVDADPGVKRQVLADHEQLMVVAFRFEKGAQGLPHNHKHVQSTYVKSGKFRFTLSGEEIEVSAGDSFVIESQTIHGCLCIDAGELIDCFTPRRVDFL